MPSKTSPREVAWNPDTVHALGLCRMLTTFLGIWPLNSHNVFSKVRLFVVAILEVTMGINLVRELKADCVAVDDFVNFVSFVISCAIALTKVTLLRFNQARMELLIRSAVEDWSRVEGEEARWIMKKHATTGRFVFIFQMSSAFLSVLSLVLGALPFSNKNEPRVGNATASDDYYHYLSPSPSVPPILPAAAGSQRLLPMGTGCFVADLPTALYALVYVVQVVQLLTTCAGNIGTDVYFFSVTLHVCAQFEILKIHFEAFGRDCLDLRKCREELETLVTRHNRLITLSNNFEETFNLMILAQLSANALHMSLLGLQVLISLQTGNGVAVIGALIATYILSLQLFLYSYAGDYLSTQGEKLRDAVYCCRWYDMPPTLVRDLIFVMSRSNVAFHLTAGKVYRMNVENFKNLLKAFASYFSMLRIIFDA